MKAKKGTTTVVLVCKNGVVFAADKQASAGSGIASRPTQTVFHIDDSTTVALTGSLCDAQNLVQRLKAEITLRRMEEKHVSTRAVASMMPAILYGNRYYPTIVWLLLVGYYQHSRAFSIDPFRRVTDMYGASGSGMQVAHSVLEDQVTERLDLKEGINVAVRAVRAALRRDLATGEGIAFSIITPEGYKGFTEEEVQNKLAI